MLRVTDIRLPCLGCSHPGGTLDVDALLPRNRLDRIGEPLRETSLLRIVVFAETLVVDVRARHDVVLGGRNREELTESFSMFLDEPAALSLSGAAPSRIASIILRSMSWNRSALRRQSADCHEAVRSRDSRQSSVSP